MLFSVRNTQIWLHYLSLLFYILSLNWAGLKRAFRQFIIAFHKIVESKETERKIGLFVSQILCITIQMTSHRKYEKKNLQ